MDTFRSTITHFFKLIASSIICSVIFLTISNRTYFASQHVSHFLLLFASLLIFQGTHILFCRSLFLFGDKKSEYFIPALSAYGIYLFAAVLLYILRQSGIYNYLFLPTRFLEPVTVSQTLSMTVAHIISIAVIFLTYFFCAAEQRSASRYDTYGSYGDY